MIGIGRNDDYSRDHGFSHDARDIYKIFNLFNNIVQHWPQTKEEIPALVEQMVNEDSAWFISLKR